MTKIIYNYHPDTGEFLEAGEARQSPRDPEEFFIPGFATGIEPPAKAEGQAVIFDSGQWSLVADVRGTWHDINGQVVEIGELSADVSALTRIAPPGPDYEFTDGAWAQSAARAAARLVDLKTAKNAEINADRLTANRSTFVHAGKVFACDELSRSDIDGTNGYVALYGALPLGWVGGWKTVANDYHPIADVTEWKAFYTSMFAAGAANFAKAQALKAALTDATTAEQVAAIVW